MARPLSAALAAHVVDWKRRIGPLDWAGVFGRSAPLALEIGFGNGSFLQDQAAAQRERDHVGIELSWTAATHLFRRLHRSELDNVRIVLGDADFLVRELFAARSLGEVFVNHPCPWPKSRHVERRLLTRTFLARLAERMRDEARLTIVTDHAEYARWLGAELRAVPTLASCHATDEVAELAGRRPTKYQLKAMAQGIPIHYFQWRKLATAASEPPATCPREIPMTTLTLSGARVDGEPFRDFHPLLFREVRQEVEIAVRLEAVFRRADRPVWLVETLVAEGPLRQEFGIDVVQRGTNLLVRPSRMGNPYPTHGVKRAVWCVARWLASRDPGLVVANESLGLADPPDPWPGGAE
jgi:tRNA (guanine-N7-)-methyltransferase